MNEINNNGAAAVQQVDVVEIILKYINEGFPRTCPCCSKVYNTLPEYLRNTTHQGDPVSYDAECGDWEPKKPIGTVAMANCSCGTTMAISSANIPLTTMWRLMFWARMESFRRKMTLSELLSELREQIEARAFELEKME